MKKLDDVTLRCFPSLAAYIREVRRRELLALVGLVLSAYVIGRDALSAYQGRVATENMLGVIGRVNNLEETCQKDYPKRLTMTKPQAQVIAQRKEDERREGE